MELTDQDQLTSKSIDSITPYKNYKTQIRDSLKIGESNIEDFHFCSEKSSKIHTPFEDLRSPISKSEGIHFINYSSGEDLEIFNELSKSSDLCQDLETSLISSEIKMYFESENYAESREKVNNFHSSSFEIINTSFISDTIIESEYGQTTNNIRLVEIIPAISNRYFLTPKIMIEPYINQQDSVQETPSDPSSTHPINSKNSGAKIVDENKENQISNLEISKIFDKDLPPISKVTGNTSRSDKRQSRHQAESRSTSSCANCCVF